jgi:hypothetical protein
MSKEEIGTMARVAQQEIELDELKKILNNKVKNSEIKLNLNIQ